MVIPNKRRATPPARFLIANPQGQVQLGALLCRSPLVVNDTTARAASLMASQLTLAQLQNKSDRLLDKYVQSIELGLALLGLRHTSRVFQSKSVPGIVKAIISEHQAANPILAQSLQLELHLEKPHPERTYCAQHRETDLAFIERLLVEEGIPYRFAFSTDTNCPRIPWGIGG